MRLKLRPAQALASREEVFYERAGRGKRERRVLKSYRVPVVPPLTPEARAFFALQAELELPDRTAASAIGIRRLDEFAALRRAELVPVDVAAWERAEQALRDAYARGATEPAAGW